MGAEITGSFRKRINQSKRIIRTLKSRLDAYSVKRYKEKKQESNRDIDPIRTFMEATFQEVVVKRRRA